MMIKIITVTLLITHCTANPVVTPSSGNLQQVLLLGNRAGIQGLNGFSGIQGINGFVGIESLRGLLGGSGLSGLSNIRVGAQPIGAIAVPFGVANLPQANVGAVGIAPQFVASSSAIPISANRVVELAPTIQEPVQPQIVRVAADDVPIIVQYQTSSGPLTVEQSHIPSPPVQVQVTRSEEEPQTVVHEVVRPVIQEVREIIQPYRRVTQQILPVEEQVNSVVATAGASAAPQQVSAQVVSQPIVSQPIASGVVSQPIASPFVTPPLNFQLQPVTLSAVSSLPPLDLSSFRQLNLRLLPPLVAPELVSQEVNVAQAAPVLVQQPTVVETAAQPLPVQSPVVQVSAPRQVFGGDLSLRRITRKYHEYPN